MTYKYFPAQPCARQSFCRAVPTPQRLLHIRPCTSPVHQELRCFGSVPPWLPDAGSGGSGADGRAAGARSMEPAGPGQAHPDAVQAPQRHIQRGAASVSISRKRSSQRSCVDAAAGRLRGGRATVFLSRLNTLAVTVRRANPSLSRLNALAVVLLELSRTNPVETEKECGKLQVI